MAKQSKFIAQLPSKSLNKQLEMLVLFFKVTEGQLWMSTI